jgi:hypothetical protein
MWPRLLFADWWVPLLAVTSHFSVLGTRINEILDVSTSKRELYWFQSNFCFTISRDFQCVIEMTFRLGRIWLFSWVAFTVVNEGPTSGIYEKRLHLYGTLIKNCYFLSVCQQAGEPPLPVKINGSWANIWQAMPVLSKSDTRNWHYFSTWVLFNIYNNPFHN